MYWRAWQGLSKAKSYHGIDFIQLAAWALHDQMIAHSIKVLDRREQAGFWYLVTKRKHTIPKLCAKHHVLIGHVRSIEKKLELIRDKTHFHLDRRGVRDPKAVWRQAGIRGRELESAIDAALRLLCVLHKEIRGAEYPVPYYDGSDARKIAEHAYDHYLLSTGKPVDPALATLCDQ
jgi:hypothetical protein